MRFTRSRTSGLVGGLALALVTGLGVAGCGASETGQGADETTSTDPTAAAEALSLHDGWVKATEDDEDMTAVFGTLTNDSDADVVVEGLSSPVAGSGELHEMAAGGDGPNPTMREKEGGIVVPAGGEYTLEPGGDHFMLMDLKEPVLAGQDVTIVVTADDGSTVEFTVVGRSFSGARENYEGDHGDHGGDHEDDHEGDRR